MTLSRLLVKKDMQSKRAAQLTRRHDERIQACHVTPLASVNKKKNKRLFDDETFPNSKNQKRSG